LLNWGRQEGDAADRAAPGAASIPDRNAHRSKFSIEPLEPRVLLSADPISTVLYRSLQEDDAAAQQSEFEVVTEQLDAATSAEIAVASGSICGDAQADSSASVAWSGSWVSASADDTNSIASSSDSNDSSGAIAGVDSQDAQDNGSADSDAAATVATQSAGNDSGDDSSLVFAFAEDSFSSTSVTNQSARAPPGDDAVASASLAGEVLSINELTKTDSLGESEGGSSAIQLLVVSSGSDANLARAPPVSDALNEEILAPVLQEALRLWTASGIAEDALARLANLSVQIADLRDGQLGEANGFTITLDATAAGRGWFVDSTPADSSEFAVTLSDFRSAAGPAAMRSGAWICSRSWCTRSGTCWVTGTTPAWKSWPTTSAPGSGFFRNPARIRRWPARSGGLVR
jgi:hypothetical protein